MEKNLRPLSPHIQIYKWQFSSLLSITHRLTGVINTSGFIFPVKNMPVPLQIVANLMPPRWFIEINRTVMLKGGGIETIWPNTVILLGMSVIFILISIRKFKIRLQ